MSLSSRYLGSRIPGLECEAAKLLSFQNPHGSLAGYPEGVVNEHHSNGYSRSLLGLIEYYELTGVRFDPDEIEVWLKEQTVEPANTPSRQKTLTIRLQ